MRQDDDRLIGVSLLTSFATPPPFCHERRPKVHFICGKSYHSLLYLFIWSVDTWYEGIIPSYYIRRYTTCAISFDFRSAVWLPYDHRSVANTDTRFEPNILGRACVFSVWRLVWTASALVAHGYTTTNDYTAVICSRRAGALIGGSANTTATVIRAQR